MAEHDDPVAYWIQRYTDTIAEHNRELNEYRKHLGNKYKPVIDRILTNLSEARVLESQKGTPPNENSNWAPPFVENENSKGDTP